MLATVGLSAAGALGDLFLKRAGEQAHPLTISRAEAVGPVCVAALAPVTRGG